MTRPYCGEGPIYQARFRPNGEVFRICAECDAIWPKARCIAEVENYSSYTKKLGLAPLWDQLELLFAIKDEKEGL